MTLVLIVLGIVAFAALAMRRAPLWQWALAVAVLGALTRIVVDAGGMWLATDFEGGRHLRRVQQIAEIEKRERV